jgi:hypothetical protein
MRLDKPGTGFEGQPRFAYPSSGTNQRKQAAVVTDYGLAQRIHVARPADQPLALGWDVCQRLHDCVLLAIELIPGHPIRDAVDTPCARARRVLKLLGLIGRECQRLNQ